MLKSLVTGKEEYYWLALICVGCDIPAVQIFCGFLGTNLLYSQRRKTTNLVKLYNSLKPLIFWIILVYFWTFFLVSMSVSSMCYHLVIFCMKHSWWFWLKNEIVKNNGQYSPFKGKLELLTLSFLKTARIKIF